MTPTCCITQLLAGTWRRLGCVCVVCCVRARVHACVSVYCEHDDWLGTAVVASLPFSTRTHTHVCTHTSTSSPTTYSSFAGTDRFALLQALVNDCGLLTLGRSKTMEDPAETARSNAHPRLYVRACMRACVRAFVRSCVRAFVRSLQVRS